MIRGIATASSSRFYYKGNYIPGGEKEVLDNYWPTLHELALLWLGIHGTYLRPKESTMSIVFDFHGHLPL